MSYDLAICGPSHELFPCAKYMYTFNNLSCALGGSPRSVGIFFPKDGEQSPGNKRKYILNSRQNAIEYWKTSTPMIFCAIDYFGTVSPKDFKPISADEINAERGKNLSKQQVYEIRKELKLEKWRFTTLNQH